MKIVDKSLRRLTDKEYHKCHELNNGASGYMQEMLERYDHLHDCRAIMAYDGRNCMIGWALLIPTAEIDQNWYDVTGYSRRNTKYCVQLWVRPHKRGKGWGTALMNRALKHDPKPFVYSHDEVSAGFYDNYDVVTLKEYRKNLKRKKRAA